MLSKISLCVTCALLCCGWALGADMSPEWTVEIDEDIKWFKVAPPGQVIVATKNEFKTLDPETGNVIWSKATRKEMKWGCFEPIRGTALVVFTVEKKIFDQEPHVVLLDVTTGNEIWNSLAFGLGESFGHFLIPPLNALMFYGKHSEKPDKKFVVVVDLVSGEVIWQKNEMFKKWDPHLFQFGGRSTIIGNQEPLFDTDSTMILLLNKKSLRKYHIATGEQIWESKGKLRARLNLLTASNYEAKPCSGPNLGYAPMLLSGDKTTVYAPYQNTVGAFNTEDGKPRWKKPEGFDGIVVEMFETEQGLLVKALKDQSGEMKLLDLSTGKAIWKKGTSVLAKIFTSTYSSRSNLFYEDDAFYMTAGNKLHQLDLSTGDALEIASLGFKSAEECGFIESWGDGYLISGLQNMAWFSSSWELQNKVHYEPPGDAGLGLLLLATSAAFDAIGTRDLGGGFSASFEGDYSGALEATFRNYSATSDMFDYVFMLVDPTEGEDQGLGLIRVSKIDGSITNKIALKTKEPDYNLNPYQNSLVMKLGKKTLVSFQF